MSAFREAYARALAEHRELERETLEKVQAEAVTLERLPEGQDPDPIIVDGFDVTPKRRVHGTLKVRW